MCIRDRANGTAGFGPYIGDERGQAADNDIVKTQRAILSNGLILDYEDQFLLDEPEEAVEEEVVEEEGVEEVDTEAQEMQDEVTQGMEELENVGETTVDVEDEETDDYVYSGFSGVGREGAGIGLVDANMKPYEAGKEITMSIVGADGKVINKKLTPSSNMIPLTGNAVDDAIATALNFEGLMGSPGGTGLGDYGFSSSATDVYGKGHPQEGKPTTVSYTNLTLPTIYSV